MSVIFKYSLDATDTQEITTIEGKVVAVQTQRGVPCVWVYGTTDAAPMCRRTFRIFGTGLQIPTNPGEYVGTFQMENGLLVFHVFEVPRG